MKNVLIALLVILSGCEPEPPENGSNLTEDQIHYFRDPRVDVCYAYIYDKRSTGQFAVGGPGLATVPCEKVGKFLTEPPRGYIK